MAALSRALSCLAMCVAILAAGSGYAFNVQTKSGNEVRWEGEDLPVVWILDVVNMPVGSARWFAVQRALTEWNRTGGIRLLFDTTPNGPGGGPENDNRLRERDDKNEVLFVDNSEIDGNAGLEMTRHACPTCRRIIESDVAISDTLSLDDTPATDRYAGCNAHGTIIHEFGHSIGLGHESAQMAIMMPGCSIKPRVRGHEGNSMVLPDDQRGARQQYGSAGDEVNLIAISHLLESQLPQLFRDRLATLRAQSIVQPPGNGRMFNYGTANLDRVFNPDSSSCGLYAAFDPACQDVAYDVAGDARAINLCPGQSFVVPFTIGNRANSANTEKAHSIGFYLSEDAADPPFDPTDQFPGVPPLAGAIVDNEMEFDSTGTVTVTDVRTLTLSDDPDCAPEGSYRLWHGVDICHEFLEGNGTVQAGGILEDDNFALSGLFINVLAPGAPACSGLGLPASDGACAEADIRKTCEEPPLPPPDGEPQPPTDCDAGAEDCVCTTTFGPLGSEDGHPDGDHAINEFCPDDGDIERTCVSQGSFGVCTTCSEGEDRHVGCRCTSDDQCGTDLTCWGEETQNGSGVGHCYDEEDGPPSWICIADCETLFNSEAAFCLNDHDAGEALCLDGACSAPQASQCWNAGVLDGIDDQPSTGPVCRFAPADSPLSAACVSECGPGVDPDNPDLDVTCQSLGYPEIYECDLQVAGGTCRRGPL